jgi:glycosyltransferase involved in cell wall biosynthesis
MDDVCLIIPCFNEEARLPGASILESLSTRPHLNICFVNDGSTDGTAAVLESLRKQNPGQVSVLDLPRNRGKAEAVRQGVLQAAATGSFAFLGYWDADLSTPLSQVDAFLESFSEHPAYQLILGSRMKRLGSNIDRRLIRHLTGRVFATFASMILDLPVYDSQCGAKIFRREIVATLFGDPFVTRWFFDVELLARLRNARGRRAALSTAYELPVGVWTEVGGSKLRLSHLLRVPLDLWTIREKYNRTPIKE